MEKATEHTWQKFGILNGEILQSLVKPQEKIINWWLPFVENHIAFDGFYLIERNKVVWFLPYRDVLGPENEVVEQLIEVEHIRESNSTEILLINGKMATSSGCFLEGSYGVFQEMSVNIRKEKMVINM